VFCVLSVSSSSSSSSSSPLPPLLSLRTLEIAPWITPEMEMLPLDACCKRWGSC
jgi:hypothetical protein